MFWWDMHTGIRITHDGVLSCYIYSKPIVSNNMYWFSAFIDVWMFSVCVNTYYCSM